MGIEIERRFLVRNDGWKSKACARMGILQGFLPTYGKLSARIRVYEDGSNEITFKGLPQDSTGVIRPEFNFPVASKEDANEVINSFCNCQLSKTRVIVRDLGFTWEVDIFEGDLNGLVIAEIELHDISDWPPKCIPNWLGYEVTHDPRFGNHHLALYGLAPIEKDLDRHLGSQWRNKE
jgi:CYTH domain-containing protein